MPNYKGHNVEVLTAVKKAMIDKATEPYTGHSEGPFRNTFDQMEGVFRKEVVNYRVENGKLLKEVSVREFTEGDYHDTTTIETITKLDP